jgi:signal peptide peptidase SppA
MKQLPRISNLLYCVPWAILPATHAELGALYRAYLSGNLRGPAASDDDGEKNCGGVSWTIDRPSGLAVVELRGIVTKKDPGLLCGPRMLALAEFDDLLQSLVADAGVQTVLLDFSSPGGSVVGLEETAANILDLAEEKRVVAYTSDEMCSAAYWLACAAGEIYAAPSAIVGSIGSYMAGVDDSREWEMEGLELKLFRSGSLKAIGLPGKKWTPEEEAYLEKLNQDCGATFRKWVTGRRGAIAPEAMQGQWFFGRSAPAGIVDGLFRDRGALIQALMIGEISTA